VSANITSLDRGPIPIEQGEDMNRMSEIDPGGGVMPLLRDGHGGIGLPKAAWRPGVAVIGLSSFLSVRTFLYFHF